MKVKNGTTNEDKLAALIDKAVARAVDKMTARAPAVHTDDKRNTTAYVEDAIADVIGPERAEIREASIARGTEVLANGGNGSVREQLSVRVSRTEKGRKFAAYVGFLFAARGDPGRAAEMAKRHGADATIVKALSSSAVDQGGAFVPTNIAADFIELLRPASVFLSMAPRRVSVPNGNLTFPKLQTGSTAYWVGESNSLTPSQPTTSALRLDLKKLAVLVPMSNEFLRDSGPSATDMLRMDIAEAAGEAVDLALLRGPGSAYAPRGLTSLVNPTNRRQSAGATVPNITADLANVEQKLDDAKVRGGSRAWFMSPRSYYGLRAARDGNNNLVWAAELSGGTLNGAPYGVTTNLPNDVGSGGNKSQVLLAAMNHLIVGEDPAGIQIAMSDTAAYHDGSNIQAAFSRDESVVRLTQRIDMIERMDGFAIAEIYDVAWTA